MRRPGTGSDANEFVWILFYGRHEFHMTRQEIMMTRYGEMLDLISCLSVYNGSARLINGSRSHHITNYDEAISVR